MSRSSARLLKSAAQHPLRTLELLKAEFGPGLAEAKLALLGRLATLELATPRAILRLHEALCFLRAYPDDARVLGEVEHMLEGFARRADLRRHRAALGGSGIAGTALRYRFYWQSLRWLAGRWPRQLRLDRGDHEAGGRIRAALPLLVTAAEAAWLRECAIGPYAALDRLRGGVAGDAAFLVRLIGAMPGDERTREAFADALDASYVLEPGAETPSRTLAKCALAPVVFRARPMRRERPDLRREIRQARALVREASPREAERLLDLAHGVMVTRARDLDAFAYADRRDLRIADCGGGLAFAVNGVLPARRALIEATYGYLALQNGVPVGYGDLLLVGRSAAVAFNTFATFRGGEAAWVFARLLGVVHRLFGSRSFSLAPYQIGWNNDEAVASGAWWFYAKLGLAPRDPAAQRLVRAERARMEAQAAYRSDASTLRRLARWHLHFNLDRSRPLGLPPLAALGERVVRSLSARGGGDRERGLALAEREAVSLLGIPARAWSRDERAALRQWSPLLVSHPEIARWSAAQKRALAEAIRAKGGPREGDYVERFAAHPRLGRALFGPPW